MTLEDLETGNTHKFHFPNKSDSRGEITTEAFDANTMRLATSVACQSIVNFHTLSGVCGPFFVLRMWLSSRA